MAAGANRMRFATVVLACLGAHGTAAVHAAQPSAFLVSEAQSGDSNGDGDTADWIVHVLDGKRGTAINLRLSAAVVCRSTPAAPFTDCRPVEPVAGKSAVAFVVGESAQGWTDLNGDGDANDAVLYVYEAQAGTLIPTRVAVALGIGRDVSSFRFPVPPVVADKAVVFLAGERENGQVDLNGDGDALDAVFAAIDLKSLQLVNIALAAATVPGPFGAHNPIPPEVHGNTIVLTVGEAEQGGRDLNSDGDAEDQVQVALHGRIDRLQS